MSSFPRKPQKGQKALQSIYNSLIQVIDYLPSLRIKGDNKTISVNHSNGGTTIHAINQSNNTKTKKAEGGGEYQADNVSLELNGTVFKIKPPADPTKNYALCWIEGNFVWMEMQDC